MAKAPGSDRARHLPLFIAGGAIVLGVALALSAPSDDPPTTSSSAAAGGGIIDTTTTTDSTVPDRYDPETESYEPDLSGPDIGEVVVAGAADAHGLAVVGKRLVWALTEGATLASSRLDGGDVKTHYRTDEEERFGGLFAADGRGVYWSVSGAEDEPIYYAAAAQLAGDELGPPWMSRGAPSQATVLDGELVWSARGTLYDKSGAIAARDKRIVSLTACGGLLFWFETPFEGDGKMDLVAKARATNPGVVQRGMSAVTRSELTCAGRFIAWAEPDSIYIYPIEGGTPALRARTGEVTNLAARDARLWWTELHGEGDDAVSIFRTVPVEGALSKHRPQRLGRTRGYVSAISAHVAYLYWSGPNGIFRAPRPTQAAP